MLTMQTSSMLHAQEPRMSSSQVNFKLPEESRSSGVSALVSRLNSSNPGAEDADNEKSRRDPNKTKEQKMQDTFPWISGFSSLCQATVGCRNMKALECLMNKYLEITPVFIHVEKLASGSWRIRLTN
ncbi:hypothetical protein J437_LFUL007070 [Ladona fulva]|uniref:Uncharacterized protein n=1 Tax=Ladona fulva TaxID=123851 RepID=A0A8K0K7N1_LADFU|nr:hypothetical protein J437_LFUL007070 [Ladona fulva]